MTHTENTKEEVRCENLGHVCRKTNTGQVLLECTFCNETLLLRTQKQLDTYAEARVREEREAWLKGRRCEHCGKERKQNLHWSSCDDCE